MIKNAKNKVQNIIIKRQNNLPILLYLKEFGSFLEFKAKYIIIRKIRIIINIINDIT